MFFVVCGGEYEFRLNVHVARRLPKTESKPIVVVWVLGFVCAARISSR